MYWNNANLKSNLKINFIFILEQICPVIQVKYAILRCVLDFFCLQTFLIYWDGCNSPPTPFNF